MHTPPLVKMSDLQKKTKQVVKEVKEDGYRFVINRGNVEIVMISLPLFEENFKKVSKQASGKTAKGRQKAVDALFGAWKHYGQTAEEILEEIRSADKEKTDAQFIKELIEWQDKSTS